MKKLFLNLNVLNLFIISSIGMVACSRERHSGNYSSSYDMGETKDFDLKSFTAVEFQPLANDNITKKKQSSSDLEQQIRNKVLDTIFEQITGSKTDLSNELKTLKKINWQIVDVKFELINKNQQLRTTVEIKKWEDIEGIFERVDSKGTIVKPINGLAELGLNNVKKYYDHIKNNKTEFVIEYGDKTFYSSIESAKKTLEEDNKNNIDDYHFYVNFNNRSMKLSVRNQLYLHITKDLINQTDIKLEIERNASENIHDLRNDLEENNIKFETDKPYQAVIKITDKNHYREYVPIKFQVKDINILINEIKQDDFNFTGRLYDVANLRNEVERTIENFYPTHGLQIKVVILNEQSNSKLEDNKEYTLDIEIEEIKFQIKWKK